jgi:hypothetical protein
LLINTGVINRIISFLAFLTAMWVKKKIIESRELTVVQAMDELNRVMAIPVKVRKQTIWVRTDIPPNAQNLMKAIGMRIPPKILQKTEM